mmetsp:Transcript_74194/g.210075  ORF Transcript_74194/g.210075 Transcript_74194/m.210075 type:complete len:323 (+) Transcript_74194:983-1951(+)
MLHGHSQRREPRGHPPGPTQESPAGHLCGYHIQPLHVLLLHDPLGHGGRVQLSAGHDRRRCSPPAPCWWGWRGCDRRLGDSVEPLSQGRLRGHHHLLHEPGSAVHRRGTTAAAVHRQGRDHRRSEPPCRPVALRRTRPRPWRHLRCRRAAGAHRESGPRGAAPVHVLPRGVRLHEHVLLHPHVAEVSGLAASGHPPEAVAHLVHGDGWRRLHDCPRHHVHDLRLVGPGCALHRSHALLVHQLEGGGERLGQRHGRHTPPAGPELADPAGEEPEPPRELAAAGPDPLPHPPHGGAQGHQAPRAPALLLAVPEGQRLLRRGLRP